LHLPGIDHYCGDVVGSPGLVGGLDQHAAGVGRVGKVSEDGGQRRIIDNPV
jgi:hypothetical protein